MHKSTLALLATLMLGGAALWPARADVAPANDRVEALLSHMTLDEKVGQLVQVSADDPKQDARYFDMIRKGQVGSFLNVSNSVEVDKSGRYRGGRHAQQVQGAERADRFQKVALEEGRLHIPLLIAHDVIHGYRTVFPVPLAEAASFDPDLAGKDARIAAEECSAVGIRWTFAPMMDIARDPRWGRIVEGSGEDPYLGCAMARARVRGFQGKPGDPTSVMACAKHYVAYGAAEGGREYNSVDISENTLRDVYLPPFHAAADAGVDSFMVAFNDIGGMPASCNTHTVRDILRHEWGWNGIVVSDWGSIGQLQDHGVAANPAQAAELAMKATVDIDMVSDAYLKNLATLVKTGQVPQSLLDDAVRRVLRQKLALGLFDNARVDATKVDGAMVTPPHLRQARLAAARSMVLLKNDHRVLPLRKGETVAVIGPLADDATAQLGSWTAAGVPADSVTLLQALKARHARVLYARGCAIKGRDRRGIAEAVRTARQAAVVLLCVGEAGDMSGEAHSRSSLDLPGVQSDLADAIIATGKPVVLVLMNGRPLTIGHVTRRVPGVLETWFGGTEAGPAIADVLYGDVNPAGRLPVTFPQSVGQIPLYYNHKNTGRPAISKYDDISNDPLYPFGFGLSYTTFRYSNLHLSSAVLPPGQPLTVTVDVHNTGTRRGDEVVQLYLRQRVASMSRPVLELKGFHRMPFEAGQSRTVTFILTPDDLKSWNAEDRFVQEPGPWDVQVGPSSVQGLHSRFEVRNQ